MRRSWVIQAAWPAGCARAETESSSMRRTSEDRARRATNPIESRARRCGRNECAAARPQGAVRALTRWRFDRPLLPMAAVGMALVGGVGVAWLISEGSWRTLALLCVMAVSPLALRWPVTLTFGAYVFVLPFSHVAVFGESSVAKLPGILAIGALAAAGLVQKRFVKPPASA